MKLLTLTLAVALFLSATACSQANYSTAKKQHDMEAKEITESILKTLETGWNTANGAAFAQPFADTSDFVDIRGTLHQNATRQYLSEAHQGIFMSIYKGSKVSYSLVQAHLIDGITILANAKTALDAPAGPLAGKNASVITLIIIKSDDDWKIRAFHNTLVAKQ
jgi:uncharacterized protein (TIGR02246 family)